MEKRRGKPVRFDESIWTLCNERAGNLIEGRDYLELRKLYLHMAEYLNREGKDSFCVLEEAAGVTPSVGGSAMIRWNSALPWSCYTGVIMTDTFTIDRGSGCPGCGGRLGVHFL